jgi:GT2 family glycosyltransferase
VAHATTTPASLAKAWSKADRWTTIGSWKHSSLWITKRPYQKEIEAMASSESIAFVLPTFQDFAYAQQAARSFFEYTTDPYLVVIDDASHQCPFNERRDWFKGMPLKRIQVLCREYNQGLTAGWNDGLRIAREVKSRYAVAGNSDILFTPGWADGFLRAVRSGFDLLGPVTNAPGHLNMERQDVQRYVPGFKLTDDREYLAKVTEQLRQKYQHEIAIPNRINGFFMFSETERWWAGAFDTSHVFNPVNRMVHNEKELEDRWEMSGAKIGFVRSSFIFHYRSVARGQKHCTKGWFRAKFNQ